MPIGIILKGIGGFYYVKDDNSNEIYECRPRGVFRKDSITPLPGDRVGFNVLDESGRLGSIDEILPRKSELVRPSIANIDQIAIVVAAKAPAVDYMLLDKLLITAELKGIKALICINKIDLEEETSKLISAAYSKAGYTCIELSSVKNVGFELLKKRLENRVTVFAGQSGVGKSTILNHIMDSWVMKTGSVSQKIERGKHTTRHAELMQLDCGGYVADTPGFSSFELENVSFDGLGSLYPEFKRYLNQCRFTSCSHTNEPGCLVIDALQRGEIDNNRFQRYIQLYKALKEIPQYKGKKEFRR